MLIPIQKNRVYENVAFQIRSQIEQGIWKEGDRIPSELGLAKLFQVSRGSIREAIKSLQMAGVVEAHSGQGTFVSASALQKIKDSRLAEMISSSEYYNDVLECRYMLETQAVAVAALVCTPQDADYLQENFRQMLEREENGDREEMHRLGSEFHRHIIRMMKNDVLATIYDSLLQPQIEERENFFQCSELELVQREDLDHQKIIEAFQRHDVAEAKKIMEQHLRRKIREPERKLHHF